MRSKNSNLLNDLDFTTEMLADQQAARPESAAEFFDHTRNGPNFALMAHQDREFGLTQHIVRYASGQRFAERALGISAHDQEVGAKALRLA